MICIVHKWLKITNKRCISTFSFDYRKPSAPGWRRNRCLEQRRDECRREGFPLHSEEQTMKYSRQTGGGRVIINKRQQRRNNKAWYEVFVKSLKGCWVDRAASSPSEDRLRPQWSWSIDGVRARPALLFDSSPSLSMCASPEVRKVFFKGFVTGMGMWKSFLMQEQRDRETEAPGLASERSPLCFYLCYW